MVCPFTFTAATPVGARTAKFFLLFSRNKCKSVDLPVPARPVKKICLSVFSIKSSAWANSSVILIFLLLIFPDSIPYLEIKKSHLRERRLLKFWRGVITGAAACTVGDRGVVGGNYSCREAQD